jgi:inner membrane transporter RhtA
VSADEPSDRGLLARAPSAGLVLTAIASVQFGSAVASKLFHTVGPAGAVLLRLSTASIILCALWRPRLTGHTREELAPTLGLGVVLAGMNLSFYAALHRIPLGIAVTFEFVGPLTVALSGSRRALDLLWVALAVAGILALTRGSTSGLDTLGVALALLAGAFWAGYILLQAQVGRVFPGATGLALAMCVAAVIALPIGVAQGGSELLTPRSLALGVSVGVLSSAIPYSFELEALRRIATHVFGVLMSLEPAMAALAGFLVLGQNLSGREIVGISLVVCASIGASRRATEPPVGT